MYIKNISGGGGRGLDSTFSDLPFLVFDCWFRFFSFVRTIYLWGGCVFFFFGWVFGICHMVGFVVRGNGSLVGGRQRVFQSARTAAICCLSRRETEQKLVVAQITTWLDEEWIPQDIHYRLAHRAAEVYDELLYVCPSYSL